MSVLKFAAIDVGSNAIRLNISHVFEGANGAPPRFKRETVLRMPIRLGEDVFTDEQISSEKTAQLIEAMKAFRHILNVYEPQSYMACATSAMRDAKNGPEIIKKIKNKANIQLDIIDGTTEANLVFGNSLTEILEPNKSYLYIDVGGGSTELSLFHHGKLVTSESFNIGTVRLIKSKVDFFEWVRMDNWINKNISPLQLKLTAIGTGGNINKLAKMTGLKLKYPIPRESVKEIHETLKGYGYEERMQQFKLKPDRADVILPAGEIYMRVMGRAKIQEIMVPQIGLADGIIRHLYQKHVDELVPVV